MEKKRVILKEDIVKYVFPGTEPAIAAGEDGFVVYNFKRIYPEKLGIFVPNEIDRSNYSNVFPKSFEGYFLSMDEEVEYLSRLLEVPNGIRSSIRQIDGEFVPGKVLKRVRERYTIFRFDELIDRREKTDLLCRVPLSRLGIENEINILNTNPCYTGDVTGFNNVRYYYWIMPISQLFYPTEEFYAALFTYADTFRKR